MSKRLHFVFTLVFVLTLADNCFAISWDDGGADHLWSTGLNWVGGSVPTSSQDVWIGNGYTGPVIDSTVTAVAAIIRMGGTGTTDTLTITGGSFDGSSHLILGESSGSTATVTMSGGIVNVYSVWVGNNGNGVLNVSGGTMNISGEPLYVSRFGGSGHIQLDGGTINTDNFMMFDATASMDLAGGVLIIDGDKRSTIDGYIYSGWITAYNGSGMFDVSYNGSKTTVEGYLPTWPYAYNPEPADGYTLYSGGSSLSWQPGAYATSHNVYLGTDFAEVNEAMPAAGDVNFDGEVDMDDLGVLIGQWLTDPGSSNPSADIDGDGIVNAEDFAMLAEGWKRPTPYRGNQAGTEYIPTETLALGEMYYWRIDEVNDSNVWKGDVWSFSKSFVPQTVEELWFDFDPYAEPLEAQVYREWNENIGGVDIHFKFVRYLVKTWKGQKSIMAAYYAYPVGGTNLPTLLHLHGGGQSASVAGLYDIRNHAPRGYAVMSINWGGQDMGESVNTDWGALDPTQNFAARYASILPYPETIDTVESPRNCSWYPITVSALRALTFLEAQPEVDPDRLGVFGHSMGGCLTTYVAGTGDSRVKAAAPSVGGAGYHTYEVYDLGPATAGGVTGDLELYRRTMGSESYAPHIQCPIFWLGATNDFNSRMDDVYRTFALIPPAVERRLTFAPHLNHRFDETSDIGRYLWFDQYLKGTFTFPEKPASTLSLTEGDHIPLFEVTPDDSATIVAVDLYYSHDKDALARFWRDAEAVQVGDTWGAQCPVMSSPGSIFNYLFAFANVTYQIGGTLFTISSDLHVVTDTELASAGIVATDTPSLLIDDFARGYHDWYLLAEGHATLVQFWTRKITDPKWHGSLGDDLKIQVLTPSSNQFKITVIENEWRGAYRGSKIEYSTTKSVSGFGSPQDIILDMSDFSGLTKWDEIDQVSITAGGGSWALPTPEFTEMSWVEP